MNYLIFARSLNEFSYYNEKNKIFLSFFSLVFSVCF